MKQPAPKNKGFADRLMECLSLSQVSYGHRRKPLKSEIDLKKFSDDNGLDYRVLQKCLSKKEYGFVPAWNTLVGISKVFNKPIDWFLFGQQAGNVTRCDLPPEALDICDMIKEIYACSDEQMHEALHTNLVAFKNSALKDKRIDKLEKKMDFLMELYNPKIKSGT